MPEDYSNSVIFSYVDISDIQIRPYQHALESRLGENCTVYAVLAVVEGHDFCSEIAVTRANKSLSTRLTQDGYFNSRKGSFDGQTEVERQAMSLMLLNTGLGRFDVTSGNFRGTRSILTSTTSHLLKLNRISR